MGASSTSTGTPPTKPPTSTSSSTPSTQQQPPSSSSRSSLSSPSSSSEAYIFPTEKLTRQLTTPGAKPLVLVACGSFSPITILHLQLFELAQRYIRDNDTGFEVVGNYLSPCSDDYGKSSLVSAEHRIRMCKLAIKEHNANIMIDTWEAFRRDPETQLPLYTPTSDVFTRLDEQINAEPFYTTTGQPTRASVMLLIGADLALTMSNPAVWSEHDLSVLLGRYGAFIVERPSQCDIKDAVDPLKGKYGHKIWTVPAFENDVSSTKVRAQIRSGENVLDLPSSVVGYIRENGLYQDVQKATKGDGKGRGANGQIHASSEDRRTPVVTQG